MPLSRINPQALQPRNLLKKIRVVGKGKNGRQREISEASLAQSEIARAERGAHSQAESEPRARSRVALSLASIYARIFDIPFHRSVRVSFFSREQARALVSNSPVEIINA